MRPSKESWLEEGEMAGADRGTAWLHRIAGGGRVFHHKTFVGESLVDADDSASGTRIATTQRNRHALPWVWGRPAPPPRRRRHGVSCPCGTAP